MIYKKLLGGSNSRGIFTDMTVYLGTPETMAGFLDKMEKVVV